MHKTQHSRKSFGTFSDIAENGEVKSVDLSDGQSVSNAPVDSLFDIQPYVVDQQVNVAYVKSRSSKKCSGQKVFGECAGHWYYSYSIGCQQNRYDVEPEKNLTAFKKDGNQYFYLDPKGALFKYAGSESLVTGTVGRPTRINLANTKAFPNIANACNSALGESCNSTNTIRSQVWTKSSNQRSSSFTPGLSYCGTPPVATPPALLASNYPLGGSYATGTLAQSKFNNPMDFTVSKTEGGVIYIADTGNNVVRKVFASGNAVIDFAGNRGMSGNETTGDNQVATLATIIHPRGVETDSAGNVYISSENGYIWKVDLNNKLKLLAGKDRTPGPVESSTLDKLNLVRPSGLVIDETKNLLYVADTGNNRVMALDLAEGKANQVAGNFLCQAGPEFILNGSPALDVSICSPEKIGLDENKNLLVLDKANKMVRRINFNFSGSGSAVYKTLAKDGSKIIRNEDGTFKRIYRDLNEIIYNSAGQQIAAKDRLGNTTTFTYSDGKLVTVVDPKGGVSSLTYSGGKLVSFIDPANRETEFVFDGHKLVGVNYPDGTGKSFDYEASTNLMVSETNQRNFTTSYQYGAWKRLAAVVRPDNTNIQVAENISETIGNSYTGGTMGEVKSYGEGNEEGNELSNVYTNAKGIETKLKNDLKGYVSEITDALGRKTTIERDLDGRPTKITRPNLEYTDMTYNERGDLVTRFESASGTTDTYSYSAEGKLISYTTETDGVSRTSSNTYYPNGQLYTERDPNNRIVVRTYLQNGLLYSVENDLGEKSTLGYDTRGNVRTTQTPKGEESLIIRDISGNVIQKTDAKGVTSKYGFDMFNRLIRVETGITGNRPVGDVTQYQYSGTGQLTQITDPQNNVTTFEYNSLDQLIKKTTSLGQITELAYDANGNVTWEKDPNGNIKTFEYSDTDQLLRKVLPDNLYQMAYDENENLTSISDSDSQIGFTYEELNGDYLVKTVSSQGTELPSVTLTNTYDRFGNRTQLQTPYGNFGYTFDAGNRLTNVSNPFGENFSFAFDASNRLRTITRSGSVTTMDFDQNSFMTSMVHKRGATTVTQALYTADAVGNKITKTTPEGVHNYSYDENYQLKSATNPEGGSDFSNEIFNYDSLGNRTNDQLGAYAYDLKKQRLLEDYQNFYSYDNNGNLITKSRKGMNGTTVNYIYSSENQLVEVQFFENYLAVKNVFYRYDALDRRTQRTVVYAANPNAPISRAWVYDGSEMIAEHDGELNHLATYTQSTMRTDDTLSVRVTSAGVTAGLAQASGTYNYLKDALGSTVAVTDNSGNLIQRYVYSSFGKIISIKDETSNDVSANAPLKTAYAFTNREWDEDAKLYYYRARYYAPEIGRFLSEDPDAGSMGSPVTFNSKYVYVTNNPLRYVDPSGAVRISLNVKFDKNLFVRSIVVGASGVWGLHIYDNSSKRTRSAFDTVVISTAIIMAAAYTGGTAAGAFAGGPWSGALIGGLAGGLVGGAGFEFFEIGTFEEGFIAGAIAGAFAGYSVGNAIQSGGRDPNSMRDPGECAGVGSGASYGPKVGPMMLHFVVTTADIMSQVLFFTGPRIYKLYKFASDVAPNCKDKPVEKPAME